MIKKVFILILILTTSHLRAQIVERPLPNKIKDQAAITFSVNESNQTLNTLVLPIWDDFSTSFQIPSTDKWLNSENVRVSNGIGINPPSLNVAVFDGVDTNGSPYNANSLINGATDSLTSQLIDLSVLNPDQADSVYLSFFWQLNGNGELPDSEDSLVVQFKNPLGEWVNMWSQIGGTDNESAEFTQALVQVPESFFDEAFQFRFQSYSRLAGAFDTWLVDYIYLNSSRHPNDIAYVDRALTKKPSFLIGPYTAMPTEQFFSNPNRYLEETNSEVYNFNSFFQPIQYNTVVRELTEDVLVATLNDETVVNPLTGPFERRIIDAPILDQSLLNSSADSLLLETTYFIRSGDNFFIEDLNPGIDTTFNQQIDYRVNDTVRVTTVIDDYFAYDDSDPDFAAGINQRGGQLAYAYFAEERALLTHVDINFPFVQQAGEPIEVIVWDKLDNDPTSILFQDPFSVLRPGDIGELRAFQLDTPIFVQDTFYIGFQQATNEFLAVGLDKNNDTGNLMYFNTSGEWEQNESVTGSFLMRPRFDKTIAENFSPAGEARPEAPNIYPNPSQGEVFIEGDAEEIKVYDNWGQESVFSLRSAVNGVWIDLSKNKKGIYLLKFVKGGAVFTKRIILNN
ncbi:T9SS type A sorting domain-containing protein [Roseivirga sp.]|uniref:T9SS type A sorting domain-containing protein n=1 Tax=Roseivirga sp. TaxID=1964215 RepID=UPI003B8AF120